MFTKRFISRDWLKAQQLHGLSSVNLSVSVLLEGDKSCIRDIHEKINFQFNLS